MHNTTSKPCPCSARKDSVSKPARRTFFGTIAGIGLAFIAFPKFAIAQGKKVALPLAKAEKLRKVGGFMITKIKDKDLLLIRESETVVHAVDSNCTHEKCGLIYDAVGKRVKCPCHNAYFGLDGKVLSGPPPKPIMTYPTTLQGDKIVITL